MGNENEMERASEIKIDIEAVPKFTIEEFRNYLNSQDSMGDIHFYLSVENIIKANLKEEEDEI